MLSVVIKLEFRSLFMQTRPGTYALVLVSCSHQRVEVGKLGRLAVQSGYYVYVGSAFGPGGLKARIAHHVKISRRPHWHIDSYGVLNKPASRKPAGGRLGRRSTARSAEECLRNQGKSTKGTGRLRFGGDRKGANGRFGPGWNIW